MATSKKTETEKKAIDKKATPKKAVASKQAASKQTVSKEETLKKAVSKSSSKSLPKKNPVVETKTKEEKDIILPKKTIEKKPTEKNALPSAEDLIMKDEYNHVEILKKKMEAQKKLMEEITQNPIKAQIAVKSEMNAMEYEEERYRDYENKIDTQELERLKQENEELKRELEHLEYDVNQKEEKINDLTNTIADKTVEEKLTKELEDLKKQNNELNIKIKTQENTIESITSENKGLAEESKKLESLQVENKDLKQKLVVLEDGVNKKEESLAKELKDLKEQNNELNIKVKTHENTIESITSKNKGLAEENKKLESLQVENKDLKQKLVVLEDGVNQKEESLVKELEDLKKQNNELNIKVKTHENTIESITSENKDLSNLKQENESLKKKLVVLEDDVNQKEEKIIILTNSMVGKETEEELAKQLELLKKQNEELLQEIKEKEAQAIVQKIVESEPKQTIEGNNEDKPSNDINTSEEHITYETNENGEVVLKIRFINDRIAEKDDKIKLVEDELNKLTEKDIVEESFSTRIKEIRNIKKESIKQANFELSSLAEQVKASEEKLQNKKKAYEAKAKELTDLDKSVANKPLNYTDKEEIAKTRTRLTLEKDALFIDIETNEEHYKKLLFRYKNRLSQAEDRVKAVEKAENDLIEAYLNKIKEAKTDDVDYQVQKIERENLLAELNILNKTIEEKINLQEILSLDSYDIEKVSKDYAKIINKLNLINEKYEERSRIERIILKNEPIVKEYYNAFKARQIIQFNINENNIKLSALQEKFSNTEDETTGTQIINKMDSLNLLVNDDKGKVDYYTKIIDGSRNNEKVSYYIELINSMAELKEYEKEFKVKAEKLSERMKILESVE